MGKNLISKSQILLTVILMDLLTGMEFDLFVPSFPQLQSQFNLTPFWVEALLSINFMKAFEELGLHRLEANIQPDNLKSINLVKNNGFKKEGVSPRYLKINGEWRDHERWAITYEDW